MSVPIHKTPEEWSLAALAVIADRGVAGLSVERLAKQLGVTKGSFYWHFENRGALIESALTTWESLATKAVISELALIADPRQRLRTLLGSIFTDDQHGPIDTALAAHADDPVVGPIIKRVTAARIGFLVDALVELGSSPRRAERQARIAFATYLGHFQLRAAMPEDEYLGALDEEYMDQLLASVVGES